MRSLVFPVESGIIALVHGRDIGVCNVGFFRMHTNDRCDTDIGTGVRDPLQIGQNFHQQDPGTDAAGAFS